jgi:hypothetical protein
VLVLANLVPLVGVLAWDWSLLAVFLLFWAETGIIGVFHLAKLPWSAGLGALFLVPFFAVHFGGFMFGHLTFILLFFGDGLTVNPMEAWARVPALLAPLSWALAALAASHGYSFWANFLRAGRNRVVGPEMMFAPYKRVIILHVVLVVGGFPALVLGAPAAALALLVLLKIAVDVVAHRRHHARSRLKAAHPVPEPAAVQGDGLA